MEQRLKHRGLEYAVIDAFDALEQEPPPVTSLVDAPVFYCWKSHVAAMEKFLESGEDYAVILEDDALLTDKVDWRKLGEDLKGTMHDNDLDYLQIGHISAALIEPGYFRWVFRKRFSQSGKHLKIELGGERNRILIGRSFPGTHCYVINRNFARLAPLYNDPVWVGADGYFDRLASATIESKLLLMGTLETSLAEQESRKHLTDVIDSDI